MTIIRITAAIGVLAMVAAIAYAFIFGDFGREGGVIVGLPWGVVSLVDLYVGFVLFSAWILYREGLSARALIWVALMLVLGNLTAAVYVLFALQTSGGEWQRFFLGSRSPKALQ